MFALGLFSTYLSVFDRGSLFMMRYLMRLAAIPSARSPDLFVVLPEHRDRITTWWHGGPGDFALEFVDEDSVERDMVEKRDEYGRAGVPEYLAIDARYDHDGFAFWRRDEDGRLRSVAPDECGRYHSTVSGSTRHGSDRIPCRAPSGR